MYCLNPVLQPVYDQIEAYRPCCPQEDSDRGLLMRYLGQHDNLLTRDNSLPSDASAGLSIHVATKC